LFVPDANVIGGAAGLGKGFYFTMAGMMGGRMQTAGTRLRRDARGHPCRHPLRRSTARCSAAAARLSADARQAGAHGRASGGLPRSWPMRSPNAGRGGKAAWRPAWSSCWPAATAEMVTREALQTARRHGLCRGEPVSRYFVDARVLSIFEGAEETLALKVVARSLLERRWATP
jgi:(2S)-methylsuccinyl-CoA dehydrogenase